MNILKLVTSLQNSSNNASATPLDLMTLSRTVKAMKSGTIQTVANIGLLPTTLTTSGNIYYVESEEDLYYNIGSTWDLFYNFESIDYAWGSNSQGQIGDNTTSNRSSPVTVVGGITNWKLVSGGSLHNLALTSTGIAYAWGSGALGQLGNNTFFSNTQSPTSVVGGITNWKHLSAGNGVSLGVTISGIAYAWGVNSVGQLGDGTTTDRASPVTIIGGITNWNQVIAANYQHSLGVTTSGIAYSWGSGADGGLGDNTTSNKSSPVTVVGGLANWSKLSTGYAHSLGITSTGITYGWGRNTAGQLGDNTTSNRSSPVTVVGGITNWSQISIGTVGYHNLGLTVSSIAYAWGRGSYGRLGDNTTSNRSSPVTVVGGITNWSQLSAGRYHSLGITSTGAAYSWGYNGNGQLGDNTTTSRVSPVTVVGGINNWSIVTAGALHNLALSTTYLP